MTACRELHGPSPVLRAEWTHPAMHRGGPLHTPGPPLSLSSPHHLVPLTPPHSSRPPVLHCILPSRLHIPHCSLPRSSALPAASHPGIAPLLPLTPYSSLHPSVLSLSSIAVAFGGLPWLLSFPSFSPSFPLHCHVDVSEHCLQPTRSLPPSQLTSLSSPQLLPHSISLSPSPSPPSLSFLSLPSFSLSLPLPCVVVRSFR